MLIVTPGPMRAKSRSNPPTVTSYPASWKYTNLGVPVSQYAPGGNITTSTWEEQIVYTVKPASQRWRTNMCKQVMSRTDCYGPLDSVIFTDTQAPELGYYQVDYNGHVSNRSYHTSSITAAASALGVSLAADPYPSDPQVDLESVTQELKPDLTQLSVPNFLLELKKIDSLFKLWKTRSQSKSNYAAGLHLNYKFGLKPTFGDVNTMVGLLRGLEDSVVKWEHGINQVFHSKHTITNETVSTSGTILAGGSSAWPVRWDASVTRKKSVGASFRVLPFETTKGLLRSIRAQLDILGFEANPRIIWEAIPFTFIVDWFLNVGTWLEQYKIDTFEIPIEWLDSYVQYKEEFKVSSNMRHLAEVGVSGGQTWPTWVTHRKYYRRFPIVPREHNFSALGWRLPSLNQALLMVSLATVLGRK